MRQTYQSAGIFTRHIGNTDYRIKVHYRPDCSDRMEDKILHMIQNDPAFDEKQQNINVKPQNNGFQKDDEYDTMAVPQMSRRSLKGVPA